MKIIDGHITNKIIRLSNNQFAGLREKFAQADFLLEGANMIKEFAAAVVPKRIKDRHMALHCIHCLDYTHRGGIAQGMAELDFNAGARWDFDTCFATCWKDRRTNEDINQANYNRRRAND